MTKRRQFSMPNLSDDIITKILVMLPVKSIYRFMLVSKTWSSLFSTPFFIELYNSYSIQQHKFNLILSYDKSLYSIGYDSVSSSKRLNMTDYQFISSESEVRNLTSCNGLICYSYNDNDYVLNPSTNEYRLVPSTVPLYVPPIDSDLLILTERCGFGYDCKLDDYKFIKAESVLEDDDMFTEILLYSLRSDSWKRIERIPYDIICRNPGVFVNGALHWKATPTTEKYRQDSVILSLDVGDERFYELPIPKELNTKSLSKGIVVGVLRNYLCIFDNNNSNVETQVWAMKEYGASESWSKLFIVTVDNVIRSVDSMRAIKSFHNGCTLLEKDLKDLSLYDELRKVNVLVPNGTSKHIKAMTCVRSLVSLNSRTYWKQEFNNGDQHWGTGR